jgi:hypothetical protein
MHTLSLQIVMNEFNDGDDEVFFRFGRFFYRDIAVRNRHTSCVNDDLYVMGNSIVRELSFVFPEDYFFVKFAKDIREFLF